MPCKILLWDARATITVSRLSSYIVLNLNLSNAEIPGWRVPHVDQIIFSIKASGLELAKYCKVTLLSPNVIRLAIDFESDEHFDTAMIELRQWVTLRDQLAVSISVLYKSDDIKWDPDFISVKVLTFNPTELILTHKGGSTLVIPWVVGASFGEQDSRDMAPPTSPHAQKLLNIFSFLKDGIV